LKNQYERLGNLEDLDAVFFNAQEAVNLLSERHPDRPYQLSTLAACFCQCNEIKGDLKDLDAAVQYGQEAVDLTPKASGRSQRMFEYAL
jgi:hypothetical protein